MNSIKSILLRYYHRETKWVVVTNCIIIVLFGAMCSWLYFSQHECIDIAWAECPCMMKINGSWAYNMSFWNPNPAIFDILLNGSQVNDSRQCKQSDMHNPYSEDYKCPENVFIEGCPSL
jgi:hypothetical protein